MKPSGAAESFRSRPEDEAPSADHADCTRALGELAATVAHEVRNPLAGMQGALQVLRKDLGANPSNLEIVDELLVQMARLEQLVSDLLTFAQPQEVYAGSVELHELLDRLLRMYNERADRAGITVRRSYGPGTARLTADPRQMEQVFLSLIHNAIQAMQEGGTLTVSTRRGSMVQITFRDTGPGIAEEDRERVFQPFFTTKHRGSGMGLPIARKITKAHGGRVRLESEPGRGTAVTVELPAE